MALIDVVSASRGGRVSQGRASVRGQSPPWAWRSRNSLSNRPILHPMILSTQRMITPARPVYPATSLREFSLRRSHRNLFEADSRFTLAYVRTPPVGKPVGSLRPPHTSSIPLAVTTGCRLPSRLPPNVVRLPNGISSHVVVLEIVGFPNQGPPHSLCEWRKI
jgi:hypothetical protein